MVCRGNRELNREIESHIDQWEGTIHGAAIKNMYENETEYESICEMAGIEYGDYEEE